MVKCERCGWGFNSVRLAHGGSCPRCRLRDGVRAPLVEDRSDPPAPSFLDLISQASARATPRPGPPRVIGGETEEKDGHRGDRI